MSAGEKKDNLVPERDASRQNTLHRFSQVSVIRVMGTAQAVKRRVICISLSAMMRVCTALLVCLASVGQTSGYPLVPLDPYDTLPQWGYLPPLAYGDPYFGDSSTLMPYVRPQVDLTNRAVVHTPPPPVSVNYARPRWTRWKLPTYKLWDDPHRLQEAFYSFARTDPRILGYVDPATFSPTDMYHSLLR